MEFETYYVVQQFHLGDIGVTLKKGSFIESDGFRTVRIDGAVLAAPGIKSAIRVGWLIKGDDTSPSADVFGAAKPDDSVEVRGFEIVGDADRMTDYLGPKTTGTKDPEGKPEVLVKGKFTNATVLAEDQVQGDVVGKFSERADGKVASKDPNKPTATVSATKEFEKPVAVVGNSREFEKPKVTITSEGGSATGVAEFKGLDVNGTKLATGTSEHIVASIPANFSELHWMQKVNFVKGASLEQLFTLPKQDSKAVNEAIKQRRQEIEGLSR